MLPCNPTSRLANSPMMMEGKAIVLLWTSTSPRIRGHALIKLPVSRRWETRFDAKRRGREAVQECDILGFAFSGTVDVHLRTD